MYDNTDGRPLRKRSGSKWQRVRERIIRRDYGLCQECRRKGMTTAGKEVDHIVPDFKGGSDMDDNLELLCKKCHAEKTKRDLGQREIRAVGLDGWPVVE